MAQQDAMEQVKQVVRQLIKYRFWIAISAAALFGVIAYFMGAGPVRELANKETATIKKAETDVKTYASPTFPTAAYKPLVDEKTGILTKDVNMAWKKLYDRQAPLLTWPDTVQERFRKWGRDWPKDENAGNVTIAQVDYIAAYNDYVDMVYKTFKPFDFETGEGIVMAPPKEVLLRPAVFSDEHVPGLGKIWSAQERLWIQRTLLEVVAEVNKNAKDWNSAIIRQIEVLEVGNPNAQDQYSLAKNQELEEAKNILAPGETEETTESGAGAAGGGMPGAPGGMAQMMASMKGGGGMGMRGGAAANQNSESVYYVKAGNDQQYKILPVQMTVLIDQDHVQDLLVELENSPMSIEVKDFELQRPTARVVKPEKGTEMAGMGGMGGMPGMAGMMGSMMGGNRGMTGYGGMMGQMQNQMAMMQRQSMQSQMGSMGRMGMAGMGGAASAARKGQDNRSVDRVKKRKEEETKVNESKGPSLFDPYFDIVEVTVYGQARFFQPPPVEATAEPSPGATPDAAAGATSPDAKGATAPDAKGAVPSTSAPSSPAGASQEKPATQPQAGAAPKTEDGTDGAGESPSPPEGGTAPKAGDAAAKVEGGPAKPAKPAGLSPTAPDAPKGASPKP
jgi:hypothetical protein